MNIKDQLAIQAMYSAGAFDKPVRRPIDLTPEGIDAMDKAALVELLEAHGADVDKRKGRDTLAADLKAVVFI